MPSKLASAPAMASRPAAIAEPASATPFHRSAGGFRRLGRFRRGRFSVTIGQRNDFFGRRAHRFARRVRIVRRTLPAGALAKHASQSQEDEHCERQENDGVDIEHVSHAFGYRSGTSARSAFRPVVGETTERPALPLLHPPVATPILRPGLAPGSRRNSGLSVEP